MLNTKSRIIHESKVIKGVTFTVRTLNRIQRAARDLPIATATSEYASLAEEHDSLLPKGNRELRKAKVRAADLANELIEIEPGSAEAALKQAEIDQATELLGKLEAAVVDPPELIRRRRELEIRAKLVSEQFKPASIHAGLVSIEGPIQIDDKPVTVETLLNSSSADYDELIDEIYLACEAASGLTEAQQKNSQSPTISSAPAAGDRTVSGATPASD